MGDSSVPSPPRCPDWGGLHPVGTGLLGGWETVWCRGPNLGLLHANPMHSAQIRAIPETESCLFPADCLGVLVRPECQAWSLCAHSLEESLGQDPTLCAVIFRPKPTEGGKRGHTPPTPPGRPSLAASPAPSNLPWGLSRNLWLLGPKTPSSPQSRAPPRGKTVCAGAAQDKLGEPSQGPPRCRDLQKASLPRPPPSRQSCGVGVSAHTQAETGTYSGAQCQEWSTVYRAFAVSRGPRLREHSNEGWIDRTVGRGVCPACV